MSKIIFILFLTACFNQDILADNKAKAIQLDWSSSNGQKDMEKRAALPEGARCLLRFTPGICLETVVSVWTYSKKYRNCTERLGCPYTDMTNRYRTYDHCYRKCMHREAEVLVTEVTEVKEAASNLTATTV